MTQRQRRTFLMCYHAKCGLCRIEADLASLGATRVEWKERSFRSTVWQNLVIFSVPFNKDPGLAHFAISTSRICLAHEFRGDIRGLVRLYEQYDIKTLEDVRQRTREQIANLDGIGAYTMTELDRILETFGHNYKEPNQLELFCTETFPSMEI